MNSQPVGIGLIGVGAFGEFCLAAFSEMPEVRITAVCDADPSRLAHFAGKYGANGYTDLDTMLADPAVEIVALNTPPFLHAEQGLKALAAGKHVFCEKPLALSLEEGEALRSAARQHNVHLTIDYVMRQNPIWRAAAAIRSSGVLGRLLHMGLTNHAAGLNLPPSHWFWDKAKSGGIWIEHGVHFFDAFAWVAGTKGQITAAQAFTNKSGQEDRVEALATYGETAAHFYHGFTHSGATEQTTVRLTFERGYLTLYEWVPTVLDVIAFAEAQSTALQPLLTGNVHVDVLPNGALTVRAAGNKAAVYRLCIQDGIRDLARAVRNPTTSLAVTVDHGLASLRMAVAAERAASRA